MSTRTRTGLLAALLVAALPALAQAQSQSQPASSDGGATASATTDSAKIPPARLRTQPPIVIQHIRPQDQRGLNVFEPPKDDNVPYTGFRLDFGAAFTQQFQAIDHSNTAQSNMVDGVNLNQLMDIGPGFNNATANLYLNAQLAPGIRVALSSYLSSRHHNETWVKDGYLLVDESPLDVSALNTLMDYVTLKLGHFEINYGDAHFRRSDNGNSLYNPFVGNYLLDAFTTEVGGEAYFRTGGFLAMAAVTGGEIRGNVTQPERRSPSLIGKLGYDRQLTPDLRVRLTGSMYRNDGAISNTLFTGDRAGSRYYYVLENVKATEAAQAKSGLINPGFSNEVQAYMVNPFVKFNGIEVFGVIEKAEGRTANETVSRDWTQYAGDVVYRFLANEELFVGARYNRASGQLAGMADDVSAERVQLSGGWFITPSLMLKGEYVTSKYFDFPTTDIRSGGKYNGFVVEGVVAF
jgi:hypothetical protein